MFDKLSSRTLLSRTGGFKKGVLLRPLFPLHKGSRVFEACRSIPWEEGKGDKKHFGLAQKASLNSETKAFFLPFPFLSLGLEGEKWRKSGWRIHTADSSARKERIFSLESDFPLFFRDGKYGKRRRGGGGGGAVPPSRIINSNCPSLLLPSPFLLPLSLQSCLHLPLLYATTECNIRPSCNYKISFKKRRGYTFFEKKFFKHVDL